MKKTLLALHLWTAAMCVTTGCHEESGRILVIGHRGHSAAAPENTLAAFRSAVAHQADYVELDTRESADGTIYCLHDDTVDRTSDAKARMRREKILVHQLTDQEIDSLDAGSWFDAGFAGEPIPRLDDALDVIQSGSRTLIERKAGSPDNLAKMLREKHLVGKVIVQSFDWSFLEEFHKREPSQALAVLGDKAFDEKRWAALPATGATIVAWKHTDLSPELIAQLHARGYRVFAWTVDQLADWQRLGAAGIDGIITNRPDELRQAIDAGTVARP